MFEFKKYMSYIRMITAVVILILLSKENLIAAKIKLVERGEKGRLLIFNNNDSLVVLKIQIEFSPDSEICAIHSYNLPDIKVYDKNKALLFQLKYDFEVQQNIALANDGRFITYGWSETENLVTTAHVNFYSNTGIKLKDSTLFADLNALFLANGDLAIVHALNPIAYRGRKEIKDTQIIILDPTFNVKTQTNINFPAQKFLRPTYDFEKRQYLFGYIDKYTNEYKSEIVK